MGLTFNQIENLIAKRNNEYSLVSVLFEYAILKQQLENTERHSWYFKQGIESKKEKLISLNADFEEIRKTFNEATVDFLISEINAYNFRISKYNKENMNIIERTSNRLQQERAGFFAELLRLKNRVDLIHPLEYYLKNPEEVILWMEEI